MPDPILAGRVALVTGASRGLGKAIALELAAAGARLALVARDIEQLQATADEASRRGGEARVFRTDVADEDQVAILEREVSQQFGSVSILVNNAGINVRKPLVDLRSRSGIGSVDKPHERVP